MKSFYTLAITALCTLASLPAVAQTQRYNSHSIFEQNLKAIDVKIVAEFDTTNCGRMDLFGKMRNIVPGPGTQGEESDFMADFTILNFLEVCPKNPPRRHIRLESQVFRINTIDARSFVSSKILVPENMKLEFIRIE